MKKTQPRRVSSTQFPDPAIRNRSETAYQLARGLGDPQRPDLGRFFLWTGRAGWPHDASGMAGADRTIIFIN